MGEQPSGRDVSRWLAVLVAMAMVLAACGDSDNESSDAGSDSEPTETTEADASSDDGGDDAAADAPAGDVEATAEGMCGALESAAEAYAITIGQTVAGSEHEEFSGEVNCRWLNDTNLDFLKVFFSFDSFFYDSAAEFGEDYPGLGQKAVESLEQVTVLTEGGWSVEVSPIAAGGETVDRAERDAFTMTAIGVAEAAGG